MATERSPFADTNTALLKSTAEAYRKQITDLQDGIAADKLAAMAKQTRIDELAPKLSEIDAELALRDQPKMDAAS